MWIILWWLTTRQPATVVCTAPTFNQLSNVLWHQLADWHRNMPEVMRSQFKWTAETFEVQGAGGGKAFARTTSKDKPEAFQGFHDPNMLLLVDEASGVDDVTFEVGQGAMTTPGAKTLLTGNPTRTSGYFYNVFHKARERWHTIKVACQDSRFVSPGYAEEVAAMYGRESNQYRVRVLGDFPTEDDDAIIPLHLVEAAVRRDVEATGAVLWGLDVARFGDDRTALAKRKGNALLEPVKSWRGKDTMQVSGLIKAEWDFTPDHLKPAEIMVDSIGLGAGVEDRLRELGLPVSGVNVGEAAAVNERYMRLRDELWFLAREWFDARDCCIPDDAALIAELTSPVYAFTSSGKIKAEGKDEMKKRGLPSPDLADAFIMTFGGNDARASVSLPPVNTGWIV